MHITFVNAAGLPDDQVASFLAAAQVYIDHWLASFWQELAGSTIALGVEGDYPLISAVPNTLQAGSLGFHTASNGIASGCVEMDACRRYGVPWFTPGFHELAEMLVNPLLDRFAVSGARQYPVEIADPVTSDTFDINGLPAANFVGPLFWGMPVNQPDARYDAMGNLRAPFTAGIPGGGWMEWSEGGVWSNAWGPDIAPSMIAYMAERVGRRHRLRRGH